jgi:hypothetical protein
MQSVKLKKPPRPFHFPTLTDERSLGAAFLKGKAASKSADDQAAGNGNGDGGFFVPACCRSLISILE